MVYEIRHVPYASLVFASVSGSAPRSSSAALARIHAPVHANGFRETGTPPSIGVLEWGGIGVGTTSNPSPPTRCAERDDEVRLRMVIFMSRSTVRMVGAGGSWGDN